MKVYICMSQHPTSSSANEVDDDEFDALKSRGCNATFLTPPSPPYSLFSLRSVLLPSDGERPSKGRFLLPPFFEGDDGG